MGRVDVSKQNSFHEPGAGLQRKCKCELVAATSHSSSRWLYWSRKGALGQASTTPAVLGKLFGGKASFTGIWEPPVDFCSLPNSPVLWKDLVVFLWGPCPPSDAKPVTQLKTVL